MGKHIGHDAPPFNARVLPELAMLPAYRKLGLGELSPDSGTTLLQNAKEEIAEAMHLVTM